MNITKILENNLKQGEKERIASATSAVPDDTDDTDDTVPVPEGFGDLANNLHTNLDGICAKHSELVHDIQVLRQFFLSTAAHSLDVAQSMDAELIELVKGLNSSG